MSIDERDYYCAPKQSAIDDDAYWRQKAAAQQELIRNSLILVVGIVALIWFFGADIVRFWKSLSWKPQLEAKVVHDTPRIIPPRTLASEQQFPESGSIIQYQQPRGITAKFIVNAARGISEHCVVKLESWQQGLPVIEIFVRAEERAETQAVPLGDYRVKIACGSHWYGRDDMFGRGTTVSIGVKPLQFWQSGNTTNGQILTLTKEINGNFKTNDSYFNNF